MQDQTTEFQEKYQANLLENANLNKKNKKLTEQIDEYKQTIQNLQSENKNFSKTYETLQRANEKCKEQYQICKSKSDAQLNTINEQKIQLKNLMAQIEEFKVIAQEKQLIQQQNQVFQNYQNELQEQNLELQLALKDQKHGLNLKPVQNFDNHYDVVINVDSICKPNDQDWKGWQIYVNKNWQEQELLKKFNEVTRVIGVVGQEDKGKSWLISQLTYTHLASGFYLNTKGLSIKYQKNEKEQITYLDSAGLDKPVKYASNNKIQESQLQEEENFEDHINQNVKHDSTTITNGQNTQLNYLSPANIDSLNEIKATEDFLQNFIINVSQILMIVVGNLTNTDQRLIQKILFNIVDTQSKSNQQQSHTIFIIHNFYQLIDKQSVMKKIQSDILDSFFVKPIYFPSDNNDLNKDQYFDRFYLDLSFKDQNIQMIHIVLAQQTSDLEGFKAGEYFNTPAFNYLRDFFKTHATHQLKKFDVLTELKQFYQDNLKNWVDILAEVKAEQVNQKSDELNQQEIEKNYTQSQLKQQEIEKNQISNEFFDKNLQLKYYFKLTNQNQNQKFKIKTITYNVIGTINSSSNKITPKYRKYLTEEKIRDNEVQKFIVFEFEIPELLKRFDSKTLNYDLDPQNEQWYLKMQLSQNPEFFNEHQAKSNFLFQNIQYGNIDETLFICSNSEKKFLESTKKKWKQIYKDTNGILILKIPYYVQDNEGPELQ